MAALSGALLTYALLRCLTSETFKDVVRATASAGASLFIGEETETSKLISGMLSNEGGAALTRTIDRLLARASSPQAAELGHEIDHAFQAAVASAIADIGGAACFPQVWTPARPAPPKAVVFSEHPGVRSLFAARDEDAVAVCDCLQSVYARASDRSLLAVELSPSQLASFDTVATVAQFIETLLDAGVWPLVAPFRPRLRSLPAFTRHLHDHLPARTLFHFSQTLTHDSATWRAFSLQLTQGIATSLGDLSQNVASLREDVAALTDALAARLTAELPAPPPPIVPPPTFAGRSAELARLAEALRGAQERGAVGVIHGMPGVGKSTLASAVAAALVDAAPWQVRVPLHGVSSEPTSPAEALRLAIRGLGSLDDLPPELDQLRQKYLVLASQRRALILADDALNRSQLQALAPPPGAILLATSRRRLSPRDAVSLDLQTLDLDAAAALALAVCPRVGPHAAALARLCAGLPLAIEIAAGYLRTHDTRPVETYLARLESRRLEMLRDPNEPDEPAASVAASIDLSARALSVEARQGLGALAVFDGDFDDTAALAVVAGPDPEDVVDELRRHSLLGYDERGGRLWLHALVREFAAEADTANHESAQRRFVSHFIARAERTSTEPDLAVRELWQAEMDRERGNLRAAFESALAQSDAISAARIAGALWRFWSRTGRQAEGGALVGRALAALPRHTPDAALRAPLLHGAGILAAQRAHYKKAKALLTEAAVLAHRAGDVELLARLANNLGMIALYQDETDKAEHQFRAALTLSDGVADDDIATTAAANLGQIAVVRGAFEDAAATYSTALARYEQRGDRHRIAEYLEHLGTVRRYQGDPAEALVLFRRSQELRDQLGDLWGLASICESVGLAQLALGESSAAFEALKEGLVRFHDLKDDEGILWCIEGIAAAFAATGAPELAARLLGASAQARAELEIPLQEPELSNRMRLRARISAAVGEDAAAQAVAEGATWSLESAAIRALDALSAG